jgi:hypothetical protein
VQYITSNHYNYWTVWAIVVCLTILESAQQYRLNGAKVPWNLLL